MIRARSALVLLAAPMLAAVAHAQACPSPSDTFYKNDILPDVPVGALPIAIIPGLCEGEGAASVFDLVGPGPQKITQVACPFGSSGGASGAVALVNLQIFDNVTFNGAGVPDMSNLVFDYAATTSNDIQVTSTGVNTVDISAYNVLVDGPKYAVAFTMEFNPNGSCLFGFTSNFFTDNSPCVDDKNLIYILGQGWVDTNEATVSGTSLCPLFYNGNWVIRACTEGNINPLNVSVVGSPALPGGFVNLTFNAPGYEGDLYLAAASGGTAPGIPSPYGILPLNPDAIMNLSLSGSSVFTNFVGNIGPGGTAPGIILIPNDPVVSGLTFYVAFVTLPAVPPWGISSASQVQVQ